MAIDVVVNQEQVLWQVSALKRQEQITILAVLTFFIWAGESLFEYLFQILWRNQPNACRPAFARMPTSMPSAWT